MSGKQLCFLGPMEAPSKLRLLESFKMNQRFCLYIQVDKYYFSVDKYDFYMSLFLSNIQHYLWHLAPEKAKLFLIKNHHKSYGSSTWVYKGTSHRWLSNHASQEFHILKSTHATKSHQMTKESCCFIAVLLNSCSSV